MRAVEPAPGVGSSPIPASPAPCPDRTGLYVEIVGDMNLLLADWRRAGRIGGATVAAAVVPAWLRTLGEFRVPSRRAEGASPASSSRASRFPSRQPRLGRQSRGVRGDYVQSVTAWGGPLLLRAFAREGEARAADSSPTSSESWRSASRRPPTAIAGTTSRPSPTPAPWESERRGAWPRPSHLDQFDLTSSARAPCVMVHFVA